MRKTETHIEIVTISLQQQQQHITNYVAKDLSMYQYGHIDPQFSSSSYVLTRNNIIAP
jgi:hypothetical protein